MSGKDPAVERFLEQFDQEVELRPLLHGLRFDETKLVGQYYQIRDFRVDGLPTRPPHRIDDLLDVLDPDHAEKLQSDKKHRLLVVADLSRAIEQASKEPVDESLEDADLGPTFAAAYDLLVDTDPLKSEEFEAASAFLGEVWHPDLDLSTFLKLLEHSAVPPSIEPEVWTRMKGAVKRIYAVFERDLQFHTVKGRLPEFSEDERQNLRDMFVVGHPDSAPEERWEAARRLPETAIGDQDKARLWVKAKNNLKCTCGAWAKPSQDPHFQTEDEEYEEHVASDSQPEAENEESRSSHSQRIRCYFHYFTTHLDQQKIETHDNEYEAVLMEHLLPMAFLEAATELKLPQTYRTPEGRWISEGGEPLGKRDKVRPGDYHLMHWFNWFRVRAGNLCHELIGEEPRWKPTYPRQTQCPNCRIPCEDRGRVYDRAEILYQVM